MSRTLSQKIVEIAHQCEGRREMTVQELVNLFGPTGQSAVTLLSSLLLCVRIPGLAYVLGVLIVVEGLRIAFHKSFWLPHKQLQKQISGDKVAKNLSKLVPFLRKLERYVHPRGTVYQNSPFLLAFNGVILMCGGVLLLFKGNHFLPGLGVFLLSLALLEKDILWMVLGYLALAASTVLVIVGYSI